MHGTTYGSLNWRDRAKERKRRAEELNDTLAAYCRFYWRVRASDLVLRPYGIRLIANDRVFHVYEDWPGLDRRKVSGSAWDGRKLIWRKPSVRDYPHKLGKLTNGPKIRCAHKGGWKSAAQLVAASRGVSRFSHRGIGRAWEDDTAARDVLLMLKGAALDRGAPVPLCWQQEAITGRFSVKRPYVIERGVAYPGAAIGHGGATEQEKRRATILDGQVNAAVGELRDLESKQHVEDELDKLVAKPTWPEWVLREIYKVETAPLKEPKIGKVKDLFRAVALFAEWFETNRRRAQMRKRLPEPTSGPCRKLHAPVPGVSVGGRLACGWRGGRCCRLVSCSLNDCRLPWKARGGRCDDD